MIQLNHKTLKWGNKMDYVSEVTKFSEMIEGIPSKLESWSGEVFLNDYIDTGRRYKTNDCSLMWDNNMNSGVWVHLYTKDKKKEGSISELPAIHLSINSEGKRTEFAVNKLGFYRYSSTAKEKKNMYKKTDIQTVVNSFAFYLRSKMEKVG